LNHAVCEFDLSIMSLLLTENTLLFAGCFQLCDQSLESVW